VLGNAAVTLIKMSDQVPSEVDETSDVRDMSVDAESPVNAKRSPQTHLTPSKPSGESHQVPRASGAGDTGEIASRRVRIKKGFEDTQQDSDVEKSADSTGSLSTRDHQKDYNNSIIERESLKQKEEIDQQTRELKSLEIRNAEYDKLVGHSLTEISIPEDIDQENLYEFGLDAELDGSQFVEFFEDPSEFEEESELQKLYLKLLEHNFTDVIAEIPELEWSEKTRIDYHAKNALGIMVLHYDPEDESGQVTNLAFNVHKSSSRHNSVKRFKLKSSCIGIQAAAIAQGFEDFSDSERAHMTLYELPKNDDELHNGIDDKSSDQKIRVPLVNSAAIALKLDWLERWPTSTRNDVDIEKLVVSKLGEEYLLKGNDLFAKYIKARQKYLLKKRKIENVPPVFLWNVGTFDGETYGGAQMNLWDSLRSTCGEDRVFTSYHPSFLLRQSLVAKCSAKFVDESTMKFIDAIVGAEKCETREFRFWCFLFGMENMTPEQKAEMVGTLKALLRELG